MGELEFTFRGVKQTVPSGETINIPSNAPHLFRTFGRAAEASFTCSAAGQEEFFLKMAFPSRLAESSAQAR